MSKLAYGGFALVAALAAIQPATAISIATQDSKAAPASPPRPGDSLATILADYDVYMQQSSGEGSGEAASLARRTWPDVSPAGVEKRRDAMKTFTKRLQSLPGSELSEDERLNRDLLTDRLSYALEELDFDLERIPFTGGTGFFNMPNGVARNIVIRNRQEADDWIARLEALPAYYASAIANMRRGLETGFTQPRLTAEIAARSAKIVADLPLEDESLLAPLRQLPATISARDAEQLRARAQTVLQTRVKPAQRAIVTFLEKDYLPLTRTSIGASEMAAGRDYYSFQVRKNTTTDLTPDQVHEIGLAEVARIRKEMEAAVADAGFKGSLKEFLAYLPTQPQFFAPSNEDYLARASEILKRIDYELPRYFGKLPRLTYGIKVKPPEDENSSGAYYLGDPERGLAGAVMVGRNLTRSPLYNLTAWLLHEGVPGHHLQIALGQERTDLPIFRRGDDVTPFVEGWALYSERLGEEMGIYRDPYERFGRLSFEMWRACRLVIDTGMHWKGWSRDQAVACLRDNTSLPQTSIDSEVDRYIGWPGQALAYKVGEMKISELRARAEKALGPDFSLRRFHDALIGEGALPLSRLEARMDAWIVREKSSGVPNRD